MRILIIGAGNTGCALAAKLCEMNHDIVVVDVSSDHLARLDAQLDIMTVQGSGSSPDVLEQAELAKADLVIAVTSMDEGYTNPESGFYAEFRGAMRSHYQALGKPVGTFQGVPDEESVVSFRRHSRKMELVVSSQPLPDKHFHSVRAIRQKHRSA